MDFRKLVIAAFVFSCPYILGSIFVFVFLIPVLHILFSARPLKILRLISAFSLLWCVILIPVIAYDPGTYLFAVFVLSVFISLFLFSSAVLIRALSYKWVSVFVPCTVWMCLIYLLDVRSLMTAAYDVGILFPTSAPLIWFTGSIGITALIILFNSAAAYFLAKKDKFAFSIGAALVCVFIASHLFSVTRDPSSLTAGGAPVKLALIQGDVPRRSLLGYNEDLSERISRYVALSGEAVKNNAELIVWPEFTLPVDVMNRFPKMMGPIIELAGTSRAGILLGSMITDASTGRNFDAAVLLGTDGKVKDSYYSQYPAIFNKGVTPGNDKGKLFFGAAGVTLCWEEIDPRICREYVKNGAGYFISLSSNADLDHSWLKRYASYFTRARAAENMRYFARVTQTGVTQIVGPFGGVVSSVPQGKPVFLNGEVRALGTRTFYSSHGGVISKLFVFLCSLLILTGLKPASQCVSMSAAGGRYEGK